MTRSELIKAINEKFKPTHEGYPVAFEREDNPTSYVVTTECSCYDPVTGQETLAASFYENYYPDSVHPELIKMIENAGYWFEWENAACFLIYEL